MYMCINTYLIIINNTYLRRYGTFEGKYYLRRYLRMTFGGTFVRSYEGTYLRIYILLYTRFTWVTRVTLTYEMQ